jgi:head-tail adaptor
LKAGALRHLATIYTRSTTPDAYGALDASYTEFGKYYCSMQQKYTIERAENGETLSRVRFDLHFRYSSELQTLSPSAEIVVNGLRLVVLTVADPEGRQKRIWITAEVKT